jgi:hypothetical protein
MSAMNRAISRNFCLGLFVNALRHARALPLAVRGPVELFHGCHL